MMDSLAPDDKEGYPAAHAWKAVDLLRTAMASQQNPDQKLLEHHLDIAVRWDGTNPQLLVQRAIMYERGDKKLSQAIALYSAAADRDQEYRLTLAEALLRSNSKSQAEHAVNVAIQFYSRNFNTEQEKTEDRMKVARAHLILGNVAGAVEVLEEGRQRRENKEDYQRAISQVFSAAYQKSAKLESNSFSANLILLDRAIESDPANPNLSLEVLRLLQILGQESTLDSSIESLSDQLAAGNSPLISHLMLANLYYLKKDIPNAHLHWDLTLKLNPNVVMALSSYALSLSNQESPELDRAIEFIDRAEQLTKGAANVLDIKGDILMRKEQVEEAASVYQSAVAKAPFQTLGTRKKLVAAYEKLGHVDQANRETKIGEMIQQRLEQMQAQQQSSADAQSKVDETILQELDLTDGSTTESDTTLDNEPVQPKANNDKVEQSELDSLLNDLNSDSK
jgi:tetratricopeptide (TPR) repeat protein